ncbi:T-complex protein 1, theta subunit [Kipferlia bialata]|uniref:CCT-theta n=1 Tax=Kipferlia bialata TaxID=797122 RepID=A0A9K3D1V5_9EUKA|nr:T-complex protein 1, theta subunit [Kipferlia bialata]|eukprot:g8592.t1
MSGSGLPVVGLNSLLKQGTQHFEGTNEAVQQNVNACVELAKLTRSSMGPNGMFKIVLNHLEKLFVTKSASTIVSELEVTGGAAKILIMAAQNQAMESGDATNLVISLGGALLGGAGELLRQGVVAADIVEGFEMALAKIIETLPKLVVASTGDFHNKESLLQIIRPVFMAKHIDYTDNIAPLIAEAVAMIMPKNPEDLVPESVRVACLHGKSVADSVVVKGMVLPSGKAHPCAGVVESVEDAVIAMYSCPLEIDTTETKGTVLLENADELMSFSKNEEAVYKERVEALAAMGVNFLVSQGKAHELLVHFCDKVGIMVVEVHSKFEMQRIAKSVGAKLQIRFKQPTERHLGRCARAFVQEIGEKHCVVLHAKDREDGSAGIATIVVRAASEALLRDINTAIASTVQVVKAQTRDPRMLPGAGATEMALSCELQRLADECEGLEQYAITAFAEALQIVPEILAETSGLDSKDVLTKLRSLHMPSESAELGAFDMGVDIDATHPSKACRYIHS